MVKIISSGRQKGEIASALTLLSLIVMGFGIIIGNNIALQTRKTTESSAATTKQSCNGNCQKNSDCEKIDSQIGIPLLCDFRIKKCRPLLDSDKIKCPLPTSAPNKQTGSGQTDQRSTPSLTPAVTTATTSAPSASATSAASPTTAANNCYEIISYSDVAGPGPCYRQARIRCADPANRCNINKTSYGCIERWGSGTCALADGAEKSGNEDWGDYAARLCKCSGSGSAQQPITTIPSSTPRPTERAGYGNMPTVIQLTSAFCRNDGESCLLPSQCCSQLCSVNKTGFSLVNPTPGICLPKPTTPPLFSPSNPPNIPISINTPIPTRSTSFIGSTPTEIPIRYASPTPTTPGSIEQPKPTLPDYNAYFYLQPPNTTVFQGDTFILKVGFNPNDSNARSFDIFLKYDHSKIRPKPIIELAGVTYKETNIWSPGIIKISGDLYSYTTDQQSQITPLANIQFQSINPGYSDISFICDSSTNSSQIAVSGRNIINCNLNKNASVLVLDKPIGSNPVTTAVPTSHLPTQTPTSRPSLRLPTDSACLADGTLHCSYDSQCCSGKCIIIASNTPAQQSRCDRSEGGLIRSTPMPTNPQGGFGTQPTPTIVPSPTCMPSGANCTSSDQCCSSICQRSLSETGTVQNTCASLSPVPSKRPTSTPTQPNCNANCTSDNDCYGGTTCQARSCTGSICNESSTSGPSYSTPATTYASILNSSEQAIESIRFSICKPDGSCQDQYTKLIVLPGQKYSAEIPLRDISSQQEYQITCSVILADNSQSPCGVIKQVAEKDMTKFDIELNPDNQVKAEVISSAKLSDNNNDGTINILDVARLLVYYGQSADSPPQYNQIGASNEEKIIEQFDVNFDGRINSQDLSYLIDLLGETVTN